jgi:hypothetical protein
MLVLHNQVGSAQTGFPLLHFCRQIAYDQIQNWAPVYKQYAVKKLFRQSLRIKKDVSLCYLLAKAAVCLECTLSSYNPATHQ